MSRRGIQDVIILLCRAYNDENYCISRTELELDWSAELGLGLLAAVRAVDHRGALPTLSVLLASFRKKKNYCISLFK